MGSWEDALHYIKIYVAGVSVKTSKKKDIKKMSRMFNVIRMSGFFLCVSTLQHTNTNRQFVGCPNKPSNINIP